MILSVFHKTIKIEVSREYSDYLHDVYALSSYCILVNSIIYLGIMFQVQRDRLFRSQKRTYFRFDDIFVNITLIQCAIVTVIFFKVGLKRLAS